MYASRRTRSRPHTSTSTSSSTTPARAIYRKGYHQGRIRAAIRNQPLGPLRTDPSSAGADASRPRLARGDAQQHPPPRQRRYPLPGPAVRTRLPPGRRLRAVQAGKLLFTYELQRRLQQRGVATAALAAHPGLCDTGLTQNVPRLLKPAVDVIWPLMSHSPRCAPSAAGLNRPVSTGRTVLRVPMDSASSGDTYR